MPAHKGFRVLMYHHIKPDQNDGLCVSTKIFEQHLAYLRQCNYHIISGGDLFTCLKDKSKLPERSVLITFDDAYQNFVEQALPILNHHKMPAMVFVPTAYIGGVNEWDQGQEPIMGADQLKSLPSNIDLAIHCYKHINYGNSMINLVEDDMASAQRTLDNLEIKYIPFWAYPYGAFPRRKKTFGLLKSIMKYRQIKAAFRIGNKINKLKPKPKYLIKRLDIRGDESFLAFKRKIKYGKL
ncbi:MAG: polysaccharide deacetylase family protein [Bacteroidota bacterium]|nr:polysaccharide deacetylase family protein [Bacteroidota bacterium]